MSVQGRIPADARTLRLDQMSELERRAVRLLRLWRAGPAGVAEARLLAGPGVCARLDALIRGIGAGGPRPLHVAAPGARTALGDEAVLARAVALAAEGATEDAALTCGLLCRSERAQESARLAGELGAVLRAASGERSAAPAYLIAGRPVTLRGGGGR